MFMDGREVKLISLEDCNALLDPKTCAADEIIIDDTNLYSNNLRDLLRRTISGSEGDILSVKKYMEEIVLKSPGFCYEIQYEEGSF